VARPAAPDADGIREIAQRLIRAENPFVIVARSGRNPETVPALVRLCELMGLPVAQSAIRAYQCFPLNHPLYMSGASLKDADVLLCLDVDIPWMADTNPPPDNAWVAITDVEPSKRRIPTMEFTADLRLTADALSVIEAVEVEARKLITADDKRRFAARAQKCAEASAKRRHDLAEDAKSRASKTPIDTRWLSHCVGQALDDNCTVFDETIGINQVHDHLSISRPGAYFHNPASSGGWAQGAAFGAKLAAPERDVIALSGDGFYMFGTPIHALWAANHYKAPFMAVVYQNRSYSTGTMRINSVYGTDSYAAKANYDGGYFDPPIDFAKEAEAAGAYGENVRDPAQVMPALKRGLDRIRNGQPAVISVWLARLLQKD
jgi:acetolactate synthase-1/2/3 large subunit